MIYKPLLDGLAENLQNTTTAQKKPLTVSASDDVSLHIETVSGHRVNPTNPDPSTIDIHDIAWAHSRMARFAGHTVTEIPYNVAQHCIYASELIIDLLNNHEKFIGVSPIPREFASIIKSIKGQGMDDEIALKTLLHDAHETYTGDVPSPVKRIPELRETFKLLELKLDHAIYTRFELPEASEEETVLIKFVDKLAQAVESYQFMPSRGMTWDLPRPTLVLLQEFPAPMSPIESFKAFIDRFNYLNNRIEREAYRG